MGNNFLALFLSLLVAADAIAATIDGGYFTPSWFEVPAAPSQQIRVTGTQTFGTTTTLDTTYTIAGTPAVTDFRWSWTQELERPGYGEITRSSSNEAVIVPDEDDDSLWRFVGSGSATLQLETEDRIVTAPVVTQTLMSGSTSVFLYFSASSVALDAETAIDDAIVGKTPSTAKPIFSSMNHSGTGTYVRNAGCWAAGWDLTCISPWNSVGGRQRAGTVIAPDIIIYAAHFPLAIGATVRFVTADNTTISRTVVATTIVGWDMAIARLDSDLPGSITPCKVLPSGWRDKFCAPEDSSRPWPVPVFVTDQEKKALVSELYSIGVVPNTGYPSGDRAAFFESAIGGDSGSPTFVIIDGELVLSHIFSSAHVGDRASEINAAMTALGSAHQLQTIDLSNFITP